MDPGIRQHNGVLASGAKYTRRLRPCSMLLVVYDEQGAGAAVRVGVAEAAPEPRGARDRRRARGERQELVRDEQNQAGDGDVRAEPVEAPAADGALLRRRRAPRRARAVRARAAPGADGNHQGRHGGPEAKRGAVRRAGRRRATTPTSPTTGRLRRFLSSAVWPRGFRSHGRLGKNEQCDKNADATSRRVFRCGVCGEGHAKDTLFQSRSRTKQSVDETSETTRARAVRPSDPSCPRVPFQAGFRGGRRRRRAAPPTARSYLPGRCPRAARRAREARSPQGGGKRPRPFPETSLALGRALEREPRPSRLQTAPVISKRPATTPAPVFDDLEDESDDDRVSRDTAIRCADGHVTTRPSEQRERRARPGRTTQRIVG